MPSSLTTGPRPRTPMPSQRARKKLIQAAVGALVGFGLASLAVAAGLDDWLKTLPGEDLASTAVAGILLMLALFGLIASSNPALYRRMAANYEPGDPLDAGVLRYLRVSCLVLLIAAAILLAPPLAVQFGLGKDGRIALSGALAVLLAVQTWLNLRILRDGDELMRAATAQASMVSFWLLQLGLFGWAALAKLGLAATVSLWTLMTIAMAVYLIVSIAVALRRGMFA